MSNVIIIGSGGHANVVIDIIEREGKFNILGLLNRFEPIGKKIFDYEIIGQIEDIPAIHAKTPITGGIVAIGDNWLRQKVVKKIELIVPDFKFLTTVHPQTQIGKAVRLGNGTVIMPGVTINANTIIGNHCILNTNCSIGHDAEMKNFSSLASNATLGGLTEIGEYSAIALSATLLHGIKIGNHTVIGAGAVVVKDMPSQVLGFGVPCKIVRKREIGEKYL